MMPGRCVGALSVGRAASVSAPPNRAGAVLGNSTRELGMKKLKARGGGQFLALPILRLLRQIKSMPDKRAAFEALRRVAPQIDAKYRKLQHKLRKEGADHGETARPRARDQRRHGHEDHPQPEQHG
jgi:hypothetical protein